MQVYKTQPHYVFHNDKLVHATTSRDNAIKHAEKLAKTLDKQKSETNEEVELDEMAGANMDRRALVSHIKKKGWTPKSSGGSGDHEVYVHPRSTQRLVVPRHNALKAPLILDVLKKSKVMDKDMKEEVELDEARGRPKKDLGYTVNPNNKEKLYHDNPEHMDRIRRLRKNGVLPPEQHAPSEHIINRLRQASTNQTGGQDIKYENGKTHHVSGTMASKTLDHYNSLSKPADKEAFQTRIRKSHEEHKSALGEEVMSEEYLDETFHVYDNGGETHDRYSVIHSSDMKNKDRSGNVDMLGMSSDPTHPHGFSQFTSGVVGKHLGKKIKFDSLPERLQRHVKSRYEINEEVMSEETKAPLWGVSASNKFRNLEEGYYVMRNGQSIGYHQDKEKAEKHARESNMRGGSNAKVVAKEEAELEEKKLIGKQKKLDKNDNGHLDAEDFKMLRKEELMDQFADALEEGIFDESDIDRLVENELENLEELSKGTIKSYLNKTKEGGKDYPTALSFRKSMESQGVAKAKLGKKLKREVLPDVKIKATNEETISESNEQKVTPYTAASRYHAVESAVRDIMSQNQNLKKIAEEETFRRNNPGLFKD